MRADHLASLDPGVTAIVKRATIRERILAMLPATNAEIGDALEMHSGEVARTMAGLRYAGLVLNTRPGKGRVAYYVRSPK